jgi:HEAT repeat protein
MAAVFASTLLVSAPPAGAQATVPPSSSPAPARGTPKERIRTMKDSARQGSAGIQQVRNYLRDPDITVRQEAVQAITEIGTAASLDPLVEATRDNDPTVQQLAVNGLVNFYLPGYVKKGFSAFSSSLRSQFDKENADVVPAFVVPRNDVVEAMGRIARSGASMDARAAAARGLGVIRGQAGVPDLLAALKSKDDKVIYESLIALQKIRDVSAGPSVTFLVRDLNERIRTAAIQTVGLLQTREALPNLMAAYSEGQTARVRRSLIEAMALMPDASAREVFKPSLTDKDDKVRTAALEGFARLKDPQDLPAVKQAFETETKSNARLAAAFAMVALGNRDPGEFSPFTYVINGVNTRALESASQAYLLELARDRSVRDALYPRIRTSSKLEKVSIARALGASGDEASVKPLEDLTKDIDPDVAKEALASLRVLRTRLFDSKRPN